MGSEGLGRGRRGSKGGGRGGGGDGGDVVGVERDMRESERVEVWIEKKV